MASCSASLDPKVHFRVYTITMKHFETIGQVAKRSGIRIETIRYYEKEGLLSQPKRSANGYRLYTGESVKRLIFIRTAKELGFSLKDIKQLLSLRADPKSRCKDVKRKAEEKIGEVDEKIKTLREMKTALNKLVKECSGKGPASECPILEAIEMNTKKRLNDTD